jgi:hypothetical protein
MLKTAKLRSSEILPLLRAKPALHGVFINRGFGCNIRGLFLPADDASFP